MSDDDDDFMMEEEEDEDYDFDYEDEDGEEPDVDLENKYYNAKGHKEDEPETALAEFQGVVEAETEKGDWYGQHRVLFFCLFLGVTSADVWLLHFHSLIVLQGLQGIEADGQAVI